MVAFVDVHVNGPDTTGALKGCKVELRKQESTNQRCFLNAELSLRQSDNEDFAVVQFSMTKSCR